MLGRHCLAIVHDGDKEMVKQSALEMLKTRRTNPYEYRVMTKNGQVRWILETVTAAEFEGKRYDCGSKLGYLQATVEYGLKHESLGPKFREYLAGITAKLTEK